MNTKQLVDALINALIAAGVTKTGNIFAGRINPDKIKNNIWSVTPLGGSSEGGSLAQCRNRVQLQIAGYDVDAGKIYAKDNAVMAAIASLLRDPHVVNYTVSPMSDMDEVGAEQRGIQWIVEMLIYVPGWLEQ